MQQRRYAKEQSWALRALSPVPVRIFLTLLVCALLVAPVFLFIQNYFDSQGFQPLGNPSANLAPPRDDYYGVPTEVYSANGDGTPADLCVTFEVLGLNPSASAVSLGVLVGVTEPGKTALRHLSARHFNDVSIVIKSNSGLSNFEMPLAVSVLKAASLTNCSTHPRQDNLDQNAAYRATWTLSLLGQPRAFPQDWYELDDSVGVIAGRSQNGAALPSSLVMMSRNEDLRVGVQMDQTSYQHLPYQNLPGEHQLFFTVHRPPWIITYTYWVAAMPFLLLMTLLWFKRIGLRRPLEPADAAFGLAAAMVAILPLHQVLVPSTIPGLTRLDVLFGLGICFLVGASILWVVVWLPRPPYRRLAADTAARPVDTDADAGPASGV
jgi:hypothetical protein